MRNALLVGLGLLGLIACSSAPLRAKFNQDINVTLPLLPPTLGAVLYSADPATFNASPITPLSVTLEGNASATGVSATVKAFVHGRITDPGLDGTCLKVSSIVVCLPNTASRLGTQAITLEASGAKTKFSLGDANQATLKTALQNGKIWLGLEISEGFASNANLKFSDLEIIAALF